MFRQQLLDTSRGRIVTLLGRGGQTVDEIASALGLTANAVRAQLTAMERDGVVQRVGRRPGTTRPFQVFELTPEVEQLLSQAYLPLLVQLVDVFANALPADQVATLMRDAGRGLANELPSVARPGQSLRSRVAGASQLLNAQLGASTHVEDVENDGYIIRGAGCPLAALTGKHPAVCLAMESLVREVVGVEVVECCDRSGRPKCCFTVKDPNSTDIPAPAKPAQGHRKTDRRRPS